MEKSSVYHVLVVEDGNEYIANLSTFVADGFRYSQTKNGRSACEFVQQQHPDLVFLDMRFDRIAKEELLGNLVELASRFNGNVARARSFQQDNQGLFILRALRDSGYGGPVVLSYDFTVEAKRFAALSKNDPRLSYCVDDANAEQIRKIMECALKVS